MISREKEYICEVVYTQIRISVEKSLRLITRLGKNVTKYKNLKF